MQTCVVRVTGALLGIVLAGAVVACSSGDDTSGGVDVAETTVPSASTVVTTAVPATTSPTEAATTSTTSSDALPEVTSAPCPLPANGVHSLTSGGVARTYLTQAPTTPGVGPVPVVVLLHGFNGNAEEFSAASGVATAAAAGGVLLVAPQGQGDPAGWEIPNWAADAQFVNDVLDEVGASGCAATDAVWVGGHSAGSAFAAYYGCSNTDRVAGVWLNAGLPPPLCTDRTPAVVISHGTADPVVPFGGGDQNASDQTFVLKPVPQSADEWSYAAACTWVEATVPAEVGVRTYHDCAKGSYVRLYTIEGGGHTWPGAVRETGIGDTTRALNAACLLVASARIGTAEPTDPSTCAGG